MSESAIENNIARTLGELPEHVELVAACKMRTPDEIQQAVSAGIKILGENYVQEAEEAYQKITGDIKWHFIGHLQKNKVKRAIRIFDMIESLDSIGLAKEISSQCEKINRIMSCLVEINIGEEEHKYGVMPDEALEFVKKAGTFKNIRIMGVMTMAPFMDDPEEFRPYFRKTRQIFEDIKEKNFPCCKMKYLSMGMSDSYRIAIEEGANLVRIGTKIFGPRQ